MREWRYEVAPTRSWSRRPVDVPLTAGRGAELILGPLFAQSVTPAAQVARARSVPLIAFSTDSNVAGRGVYLLSFLPESDVDRVVEYAIAQGRRSFVALVPDNAYGSVVEA